MSTATTRGEFHPSYSSQDATLVIASREGIKFRVHPIMMQMASEVFNNMLSQATDTGEPIVLHERSHTVKSILDFIYPNAPYFDLEKEKFYSIWNLLVAAEKYIIAKIFSEFRKRISNDKYFSSNPIQAYVIATRFGWNDVINDCALAAIDHLHRPYQRHYIDLVHADSKSVLKLFKFADMHRNAFMNVVRGMLEVRYGTFEPQSEDDEEDPVAYKAKSIVLSSVSCNLQHHPSGKNLLEVLKAEYLREYMFDGWEELYRETLQIAENEGEFPTNIYYVELDREEDLFD